MELSADFYDKKRTETDDKPFHEFSNMHIFDMSDVMPAEIEIEEEIRMGYLWHRYTKKSK
jgi:hypothetical protein